MSFPILGTIFAFLVHFLLGLTRFLLFWSIFCPKKFKICFFWRIFARFDSVFAFLEASLTSYLFWKIWPFSNKAPFEKRVRGPCWKMGPTSTFGEATKKGVQKLITMFCYLASEGNSKNSEKGRKNWSRYIAIKFSSFSRRNCFWP